jgi:hypothetical protein
MQYGATVGFLEVKASKIVKKDDMVPAFTWPKPGGHVLSPEFDPVNIGQNRVTGGPRVNIGP